jgi:AcrR family transcriptional regulator
MSQDASKKPGQRRDSKEASETRRLILQAAQHLFAAHGYRAVTTRQIAESCGITQPALYKHFADKQEVYTSMLLLEVAQIKTALERIVQREIGVAERLRLTALYLLNNTHHDIGMMTHDISNELRKEAQEMIERAFVEGLVQPLASLFEDGMHRGLIRSSSQGGFSPMMTASLFLNSIDFFTSQSSYKMVSEARQSVAEQARLIVQLFLHGVAQGLQQKEDNNLP